MTTFPAEERLADGALVGRWWTPLENDSSRLECQLCPRRCALRPGDRGFCFVRENRDGRIVLSTYGRSTGFCIDPIEKKPLNHFFPGTPVLSFGTAGCNLGCKFCQNWDISKSREVARLSESAEPDAIAQAAINTGCRSVAFTYNDPVVWAEYAIDTALACRALGIKTVAVTAGYISPPAREEFFGHMDAANVDLKAFTEEFYQKVTYSHLAPVLETLSYLKRETDVWFEVTNLLIPAANDTPGELRKMCDWLLGAVGDGVPVHFTAFHPDFRMRDRGATPPETLYAAYDIARACGLKFPYVGNVHDGERQSTCCPGCGGLLVQRDWYQLGRYDLRVEVPGGPAHCRACGTSIPGRFETAKGNWGSCRQPIRIGDYAFTPGNVQVARDSMAYRVPSAGEFERRVHAIEYPATKEYDMTTTSTNPSTGPGESAKPQGPSLLQLNRLTAEQRRSVLEMGAGGLAATVTGQMIKSTPEVLGEFAQSIVMGVFVTLKRGELLRGCCGVMGKPMPLGPAIASAALKTAKEDQRMAPISPCELPYLTLDVTLLGPFQRVQEHGAERAQGVRIGRHGVMIQRNNHSGLLLPGVAIERGWSAEQFLQAVCFKARLPGDAWQNADAQLLVFEGESISGAISDLLPVNLPNIAPLPLTQEDVKAYAQVAAQNIVAIATGGTPSYVIPQLPDANVNAIVLSMQWGQGESAAPQQGNAIQVSFRPGVPLQSTLFQMCQNAAATFQRQGFQGEFQLGVTVGFDPAMHGYGRNADLSGIDGTQRAIVITEQRHCGVVFDPQRSPEESLAFLRQVLPVQARDGGVHTLQVLSTMPQVSAAVGPSALNLGGIRPAAVAGKFYPAQDAARRAMVEGLMAGDPPQAVAPLAVMVPHAGLKYSGSLAAKVWRSVEGLNERTAIIVSPKHTPEGVNWAVAPCDLWGLSNTTAFETDRELRSRIAESIQAAELDAGAHQQEHGIEVQLPLLERLAPKCKVIGLAMRGGTWEEIQQAAGEFAELLRSLESLPLLVISSDMNHFAPDAENRRRDRLALDAFASGDPQRLIDVCRSHEISMCGLVPAAFILETLRQLEQPFRVQEVGYATSADVTGDRSQVVGYAGALILPV
jgi:AmmeMemoRadiSam system radical SAM enzyme/AmmeMemoRadiSam system protein B/uncharacterized protein (TIGR00296 family)